MIYVNSKKIPQDDMNTLWLFNIAMDNGPLIDDVPS